ncbi:hypothetical protein [Aquimarina celericrescens]|uniref:Cytochrome oxidase complex assembly protein 1 n=1 Tax=Aquimarina celericrescens TaxID=1964542 RepID=A0ABW5B438_9FLAO|nr:hypothetical protein [Aquimarina celericrescens]
MNEITERKSWWNRNRKWISLFIIILIPIVTFFSLTGDATFRYGSAHMQPGLIKNAYEMANKNEIVSQKLGQLSEYNFLRLIEGDVLYDNNGNTVYITVNLLGTKKKGKLDIYAHQNGEKWEYQKVIVRIKKPRKETIKIFEK